MLWGAKTTVVLHIPFGFDVQCIEEVLAPATKGGKGSRAGDLFKATSFTLDEFVVF